MILVSSPLHVSVIEPDKSAQSALIYWFNPQTLRLLVSNRQFGWLPTIIHMHEWTDTHHYRGLTTEILLYNELLDIAVIMGYL